MNGNVIDELSDSIKIIKNSKDKHLPTKPKILSSKKSQKQQISELLIKSSPLKLEKENNQHENKSQKVIAEKDSIYQPENENENKQRELNHQRSDSLATSENTSSLCYDHLNKSQSTSQLHYLKDSSPDLNGENINLHPRNDPKSKSKLIRKQTIPRSSSKLSETKENKLQSSTSPEFMAQNRFYHYCAQQIIKLSAETNEIKAKIQNRRIETLKIKEMNKELEAKIEKQKKEMQNYEDFKSALYEQRTTLKEQISSYEKEIFENLPEKYKNEYRKNQQEQANETKEKMDQIKKQEEAIESLREELDKFAQEEIRKKKISNENTKLREEIEKVRNKRLAYDEKILKKNHVINHLYEIKIVEYENLLKAFE